MNYCGIDLAGKSSAVCIAEKEGEEFCEFDLPTDEKSFTKVFGEMLSARCLLEASPLAEWAAGIIEGLRQGSRGGGAQVGDAAPPPVGNR